MVHSDRFLSQMERKRPRKRRKLLNSKYANSQLDIAFLVVILLFFFFVVILFNSFFFFPLLILLYFFINYKIINCIKGILVRATS